MIVSDHPTRDQPKVGNFSYFDPYLMILTIPTKTNIIGLKEALLCHAINSLLNHYLTAMSTMSTPTVKEALLTPDWKNAMNEMMKDFEKK